MWVGRKHLITGLNYIKGDTEKNDPDTSQRYSMEDKR